MGDKITAKNFAEKFNIPTVPGYSKDLPDDESRLKKIVDEIGYPIILKATAGGGGRGMRVVTNENDLLDSLKITKQEALNALEMIKFI